jgi:hypothetical protein
MTPEIARVESRIRLSSRLIAAGLLAQLLSLTRIHPLAFVGFVLVGGPLIAAGIVIYLMALAGPKRGA